MQQFIHQFMTALTGKMIDPAGTAPTAVEGPDVVMKQEVLDLGRPSTPDGQAPSAPPSHVESPRCRIVEVNGATGHLAKEDGLELLSW
jgi:hypothetical protein